MSRIDKCLIDTVSALGKEIDEAQARLIKEETQRIIEMRKEAALNESFTGDLEAAIKQDIDNFIMDQKTWAKKEQIIRSYDQIKQFEMYDYVLTDWSDNVTEGMRATLFGSNLDRFGSRSSKEAIVNMYEERASAALIGDIESRGYYKLAEASSDELKEIVSILNTPDGDKAKLKTFPKELVEIGEIIYKHKENGRLGYNEAGGWIPNHPGRYSRRVHNADKIAFAAGYDLSIPKKQHRQVWINKVLEHFDMQKSFPELSQTEVMDELVTMYDQLSTGVFDDYKGAVVEKNSYRQVGKVGSSMAKQRVLIAKSFKDELAYEKLFGNDTSYIEDVFHEVSKLGKHTGMLKAVGPSGWKNLDNVYNRLMKHLKEIGDVDQREALRNFWKGESPLDSGAENWWKRMTGELERPGTIKERTIARRSAAFRSGMLGDLSGSALAQVADVPLVASLADYAGERSTFNFLKKITGTVEGTLDSIAKKTKTDKRVLAAKLGLMFDSLNGAQRNIPDMGADFDKIKANLGDGSIKGVKEAGDIALNKWGQAGKYMFKYSGMEQLTNNTKFAAAQDFIFDLGSWSKRSFADLPEGRQTWFKQFGITADDWDFMRKADLFENPDGYKMLTPEAVERISLDSLKSHPDVKAANAKVKARGSALTKEKRLNILKKKRQQIIDKFNTSVHRYSQMAVSEPTQRTRAQMLRGSKPGTIMGESWKSLMTYKTFAMTVFKDHLMRNVQGFSASKLSTREFLRGFMGMSTPEGNSAAKATAQMIVSGAMAAYVSMSLRDISKGLKPRVPETPEEFGKVLLASLARSGGLGLYGDFIFGDLKSRFGQGPLMTFLGPGASRVNKVMTILGKLKRGESITSESYHFLVNNIPGVSSMKNHFMTSAAFNYLIGYRFLEFMNPGALERYQNTLKKNTGQEFISDPYDVIPYGGF